MIGLGLPRGFLVTLKNFFRAPVTVQYPDRHVGLFGAAKEAGMNPFRFVVKRPVDSIKAIAGQERRRWRDIRIKAKSKPPTPPRISETIPTLSVPRKPSKSTSEYFRTRLKSHS